MEKKLTVIALLLFSTLCSAQWTMKTEKVREYEDNTFPKKVCEKLIKIADIRLSGVTKEMIEGATNSKFQVLDTYRNVIRERERGFYLKTLKKSGSTVMGRIGWHGRNANNDGDLQHTPYIYLRLILSKSPFFIKENIVRIFEQKLYACDNDYDLDGIPNDKDGCPFNYNTGLDYDSDGIDDACDNCIRRSNPDQKDTDDDGFGDVCDNCPDVKNKNQKDSDYDDIGNACDNCKFDKNEDQSDTDKDGHGDKCDNCPDTYNKDQAADKDGDGIGDACDPIDDRIINLTLKKNNLKVRVGDNVYYPFRGDTPVFKHGAKHEFSFEIENNQGGKATNVEYELAVSSSSDSYPIGASGQAYPYNGKRNVGTINGNSSKTDTFTDYIYESISTLSLSQGGTYFMFMGIDPLNRIDETKNFPDKDNVFGFQFTYTKNTINNVLLNTKNGTVTVTINDDNIKYAGKNNIKIYSLNNSLLPVLDKEINSSEPINIQHLATGNYAVHINDKYVKKLTIK